MKILILLTFFVSKVYAGTCTSISRTNYTANQILTSSSLNTQLNTVYSAANALDGGCVSDGTLEPGSLNTTDFATLLRGVQIGCKVTYSSANVVSISACYASVNGAFVNKSSATTATMGCTNCSADSASTQYYIYIATGSSGSTLTPLILTTAPNADGYDASGNKVLARIYNNASSAFDQYSIDQWNVNQFVAGNFSEVNYTPTISWVSNASVEGKFKRMGSYLYSRARVTAAGAVTATALTFDLPSDIIFDSSRLLSGGGAWVIGHGMLSDATALSYPLHARYTDSNTYTVYVTEAGAAFTYENAAGVTQNSPITIAANDTVDITILIPVAGWSD